MNSHRGAIMAQAILNFPRGFLWGTATAAHQVEGNNINNNWYAWEKSGHIINRQSCGLACDWWGGRWREDFDRAAENGQNAHRLSIEWSRIQPDANRWDEDALDYYRQMVRGLLERGMTPLVTLHHFTEPLWISEMGGWQDETMLPYFDAYVAKVVEALQEYVTWWCTINEPNVYASMAYLTGDFPPGKSSLAAVYKVIVNLIKGHALAYQTIHEILPDAKVGLAHQYRGFQAAKPLSPLDRWATNMLSHSFTNAVPETLKSGILRFLGIRKRIPAAKGTQDFLGVNYYTQENVAFSLRAINQLFGKRTFPQDADLSPTGFIANQPEGFYQALKWAKGFKFNLIGYNEFGSGIISSRITINGLLYDTYPAETQEATINLGNDSYKNIYVITYDKAGNSAESNFAVILDRLAPTLLIDNPENNFTSGLNYTIVTWNANDAGVGVLKYDILIDGAIDVTIADPDTNLYYVLLPIPKTYNITVRVTDVLGYSFEQTINVTYDPLAPTILITSPTSMESYSNSSTITVNWDINNLIIDHFEIYYNDTHVGNYTSTIFTAEIYFADIIPNEYQVYNVTIYAITTEAKIYSDFHWIIIDQVAPTISISSPGSINPILDYDLQIEWFGEDEKSGIEIFVIEISTTSIIKSSNSVSHILDVTGLDGFYNLTIIASDVAGNKASDTVEIQIALLIPDFITTLEPITIHNDFEIQFNLTITNPRLGIKSISIYADGSENVYTVSYGTNYVTVPFWLLVNTSASDFQGNSGLHNMSISVIDRVNRETKKNYAVVIDQENPEFWPGQDPVLGSIVLSTSTNEVFWNDEPSSNIYDLKIFIKELYGLSGVNISIVGDGYDETYQMIHNVVNSHDEHHQYDIKLDFNDLSIGDYSLIFSFKDTAGNSNNKAFSLSLKAAAIPTTPTTVIEPTNSFLYIILGASLAIVLAFVFSLTLRQPLSNIGWQKELVVVVFVLRSGLTAVFVPYSHEITTDDQLFGGAMSGIRGILEEIIGMRGKAEVEKVEFGDKTLLICPGEFGDAVLLVHKDKPIHSKLLSNFAAAFEEEYVDALQNDTHVNFSQYEGTIELIESFFGPIEDLDLQLPLQAEVVTNAEIVEPMKIDPKESLLGSFYQEIFATNDQFIEISDKTKVFIGDAIILVEQSLNALISRDFKMAEGKAKTALKSLEFARQSKEPVGDFSKLIRVLPRIAEIVLNGAESSKRGDTKEVHMAIEMASQLFLEQIT